MRVSIIGTGYVGLVTGACLAEAGHEVICVDRDERRVEQVDAGVAPFYEPGLADLLSVVTGSAVVDASGTGSQEKRPRAPFSRERAPRLPQGGRLTATTDLAGAVADTELTMIAVGTPFDGERIDLSFVEAVAAQVGEALRDKDTYHVVVVKSTVVPGSTERVVLPLLEKHSGRQAGRDFGVGMNPEFLSEGQAVSDFREPDRIVLGGIDERTLDTMARLYEPWQGVRTQRTTPAAAEMIKYASNALQATLISFSNELANLAAVVGVDIVDVQQGVHASHLLRGAPITSFLKAGCGFGGSCFPKDVAALASFGVDMGVAMPIAEATLAVNRAQPLRLVELVRRHFPALSGVAVTVLGAAFKPGTDDLRESPAFPVVRGLRAAGARVTVYDPVARMPGENQPADLTTALAGAQVVVGVTAWPEFAQVPALLSGREPQPLVVDGRRMWTPSDFAWHEAIGLGLTR